MRLLHCMWAKLFGYFWLPCPVCGKMFGGHEIHDLLTIPLITDDGRAKSVCSLGCGRRAQEMNDIKGHFWPIRIEG